MERVILHCDCNSFYASVECVLHPELKDIPMAVCGDPKARHGIILAKNEHAKRFGVQTAETIREALKKCPQLQLVSPHHRLYSEFSRRIFDFYNQFTDQIEPFGIDEAWLDVTGSQKLFGTGEEIAEKIRLGVKEAFGLTVSVGVSFNKAFAKLASDYKKPDAVTVFSPQNWREYLFPLPVGTLLFIGPGIEEKLAKAGIFTLGQLAGVNRDFLVEHFGKHGELLYKYANGLDDSPVARYGESEPLKSIGNSITFPRDLEGEEDIRIGLRAIADRVAFRLRAHECYSLGVSVVIKDKNLHTITRQISLTNPTHLSDDLVESAWELVRTYWNLEKPIRMLGITAHKLTPEAPQGQQLSIFDPPQKIQKRKRLEGKELAMDRIRSRYGKKAITPASIFQSDLTSK